MGGGGDCSVVGWCKLFMSPGGNLGADLSLMWHSSPLCGVSLLKWLVCAERAEETGLNQTQSNQPPKLLTSLSWRSAYANLFVCVVCPLWKGLTDVSWESGQNGSCLQLVNHPLIQIHSSICQATSNSEIHPFRNYKLSWTRNSCVQCNLCVLVVQGLNYSMVCLKYWLTSNKVLFLFTMKSNEQVAP